MATGDILIIDDTYEDIETLDMILRDAGHTVRAVRDGDSGLRAARHATPDLVLLDVMLPVQDGFQICDQFRADERLRDIPIIFISALHDVQLKAQAFEHGGYDYITKPFNRKEITVRIHHQLERIHLREALKKNAQLKERQRIARELHDSVNQTLFVLSTTVQSLLMDADVLSDEHQNQLTHLNVLSKSAMAEMRTLLNELRPSQVCRAPLQKSLGQLAEAYRLRFEGEIRTVIADGSFSDAVKLAVYRVTQEALNNAAKYAGARHVSIHLLDNGDGFCLEIIDDGCGFDPNGDYEGMDLQTMQERTEQLGMAFSLITAPGEGTHIRVTWQQ